MNGLQVGTVSKLVEKDQNVTGVVVVMNLTKDIHIPKNSIASINASLLGTANLDVRLGNDKAWVEDGDTILAAVSLGMFDKVTSQLAPVLGKLELGLKSLDSVVQVIGSTFDPATKNNLRAMVANFAATSGEIKILLNSKSGPLAHTLQNIDSLQQPLRIAEKTSMLPLGISRRFQTNLRKLNWTVQLMRFTQPWLN